MPRIILLPCVPLLLLFALNPVIAQSTAPTLVGSWEFTATPETTSDASRPAIEGLATFTSDGTAIETDTTGIWGGFRPATAFGKMAQFQVDISLCGSRASCRILMGHFTRNRF